VPNVGNKSGHLFSQRDLERLRVTNKLLEELCTDLGTRLNERATELHRVTTERDRLRKELAEARQVITVASTVLIPERLPLTYRFGRDGG
jgi:hypothetical protein